MKFTVFGGSGFVGRNLVRYLNEQGHEVFVPIKSTENDLRAIDLGHVIYAIGLTGDFRTRPFDTVDAHVTLMSDLLKQSTYESWLYLSSTRVYGGLSESVRADEQVALPVFPDADGLYNISKLLGESICFAQSSPKVRAVRLSNVYGVGQSVHTFLGSIINELKQYKDVSIRETADSAKDYVSIHDVCELLEKIALTGQQRLYNVAGGMSVMHGSLVERLRDLTSSNISFEPNGTRRTFPHIDISRITQEFNYHPEHVFDGLHGLLQSQ